MTTTRLRSLCISAAALAALIAAGAAEAAEPPKNNPGQTNNTPPSVNKPQLTKAALQIFGTDYQFFGQNETDFKWWILNGSNLSAYGVQVSWTIRVHLRDAQDTFQRVITGTVNVPYLAAGKDLAQLTPCKLPPPPTNCGYPSCGLQQAYCKTFTATLASSPNYTILPGKGVIQIVAGKSAQP